MKINQLKIDLPHEGKRTLLVMRSPRRGIIASLSVKLSHPVADFSVLYVAPAFRRRGYGRALVAKAAALARRVGCVSLSCSVHSRNMAAANFYHALGFILAYRFQDGDFLASLPLRRRRKRT